MQSAIKIRHLYTILHRITKSNSSENPSCFNIKFEKPKVMEKERLKTLLIYFLLGIISGGLIGIIRIVLLKW